MIPDGRLETFYGHERSSIPDARKTTGTNGIPHDDLQWFRLVKRGRSMRALAATHFAVMGRATTSIIRIKLFRDVMPPFCNSVPYITETTGAGGPFLGIVESTRWRGFRVGGR